RLERRPNLTIRREADRLPNAVANAQAGDQPHQAAREAQQEAPGSTEHRPCNERCDQRAQQKPSGDIVLRETADVRTLTAARANRRVHQASRADRLAALAAS